MSPLNPSAPSAPDPDQSTAPGDEARQSKRYWKSLERLHDSPALQEAGLSVLSAEGEPALRPFDEFPAGASDRPDAMSRRTMMGLMGASFALAGGTACRRPEIEIVPYVNAPEGRLPGVPRHYATTVTLGTEALGVVVETHDGRPTKVEGNELHPDSGGGAGAWAQATILDLYDPERSRNVRHAVAAAAPEGESDAEAGPAEGDHGDEDHGDGGDHGESHGAAGEESQGGMRHEASTWPDFETAWGEIAAAEEGDGRTLAVLAEASCSPTRTRLEAAFRQRFPNARWLTWEPVNDENVFAGVEAATGQALRPVLHLEQADVVLALDADLFGTESGAVRHARGFAVRRRVATEKDSMNRLYAVESTVTTTSAMADHRLRLKSSAVGAFAAALAAELGAGGGSAASLPASAQEALSAIAEDLRSAGPRAIVAAGRHHPPEVHALVLSINQALGAVGTTVTLHELTDVTRCASSEELRDFVEAMGSEIETLVVLGGNPVYTLPGELAFAKALSGVRTSIHLGATFDETGRRCNWHLPQSHAFESWGDARAADGTWSLVQPLIAPLFDSRSALAVLALMAGQQEAGTDMVRRTAASWVTDDRAWRQALHDGAVSQSSLPAVNAAANVAGDLPPAADGMEIVFLPSRSVYDGRFANNAWLQELPDPITKITWNNAALLSPATAAELGVEAGDRVSLELGGRSLEAPVWVLPGQADGSVALSLGYGRNAAGRVGNGVGVNASVLRGASAAGFAGGLQVTAVGGGTDLVQTQEHWSLEGRPLLREASLPKYRANPDFVQEDEAAVELKSLWEEPDYSEGHQWGMAIDLNLCTGCNACVVACQSENNIPVVGPAQVAKGREMHWLRVDRYFSGDEHDPEVVFQPIPCMHCENAPCEQVCPVAATVHDREGINAMVYNRCIGTRYCSNNCPYKVRRFNFFNFTKDTPELAKMAMNPDVTVRSRGVMEKCTYCIQRINQGKIEAKRKGESLVDGAVRTACQQTCPTDAIVFGDLNDAESSVTAKKAENRNYVMLGELNNKPRTSYLAKLRNPNERWPGYEPEPVSKRPAGAGHSAGHGSGGHGAGGHEESSAHDGEGGH